MNGHDDAPVNVFSPGKLLCDELAERGIDDRGAARALGVSVPELHELFGERVPFTEQLAWRIGRLFGTSREMWVNPDRVTNAEGSAQTV